MRKKRMQRALAFFLAVLLVIGSVFTGDISSLQAYAVETAGDPSGGPTNDPDPELTEFTFNVTMPEKTADVEWGNPVLTIFENGNTMTTVNLTEGGGILNGTASITKDDSAAYTYSVTCDNYTLENNIGTLDFAQSTVDVSSITAKPYYVAEILGSEILTVEDTATYTLSGINLNVWADTLNFTWAVESGDCIQIEGVQSAENCTVKAVKAGTATVQVTDRDGYVVASQSITVNKKDVSSNMGVAFEPTGASVNDAVSVTVSGVPANVRVWLKISEVENEDTTYIGISDSDGKVKFSWTPVDGNAHTLSAEIDSDSYTGTAAASYTANKLVQSFTIEEVEDVDVTYGDGETVIASITNGDGIESASDDYRYSAKVYAADENGNKTDEESDKAEVSVNVDSGEISLTPKAAGKVYVEITKTGNDVYADASNGFVYEILPKELTIVRVQAVDRVYDGKTSVNVSATVEGFVDADKDSVFDPVSGTGKMADANAGENKEVISTMIKLPENGYENYMLKEGDIAKIDSVNATVTIAKKPLLVTIEGGTRAFRETNDQIVQTVTDRMIFKGFVDGEDKAVLKNSTKPSVSVSVKPTEGIIGVNKNAIEANLAEANDDENAPVNYVYASSVTDDTTYNTTPAVNDLTITAETVDSFTKYVAVGGTNVYQETDDNAVGTETVYYGYSAEATFSINDDTGVYTKLREVTDVVGGVGSGDLGTDVTADGVTLSGAMEEEINLTNVTKTFYLTNGDGTIYSKPFDITFTVDTAVPQVELSMEDGTPTVNKLAEMITFGVFKNEQTAVSVTVTDSETSAVSGIKNWQYAIYNCSEGTGKSYEDYKDSLIFEDAPRNGIVQIPVAVSEMPGKYILFVKVTDNVGNQIIYASNGMIFECSVIETIDIYHGEGVRSYNYVNSNQTVTITATDEDESNIYSGVAKIDYTVSVDGKTTEYSYLTTEEGKVPNVADLSAFKEATVVDQNNQKPVVSVGDNTSAVIKITATATDFAGNEIKSQNAYSHSFVIDKLAPVIANSVTSASTVQNSKYYNKDVVLTTTITERFLDINNALQYTINGETVSLAELKAHQADFGISSIVVDEGAAEANRTDSSKSVVTITFHEDNVYTVKVSVTDKAGNSDAKSVSEFVIDQTAPVVNITYYSFGSGKEFKAGTNVSAPAYLNGDYSSFKAVVSVDELNFAAEDNTVISALTMTAKDSANIDILADFIAGHQMASAKASSWSQASGNTKNYEIAVQTDANYSFAFEYTDLAGNKASANVGYVTLDRVAPSGSITADGLVNDTAATKTWFESFLSTITFGLFGKNDMGATMESSDVTSGVASTWYLATSELLTKTDLAKRTDWTAYTGRISLTANQNVIVYEKVVDKAGNISYFSTENLVADNINPVPTVTITPTTPGWGKGVYSAGDNPGFDISVTDPSPNGTYSGLKEITYRIVNGTTGYVQSGTLASIARTAHQQNWTGHVSIDPTAFYSNDVQVTVSASDWSTNPAASETQRLKVDNEAPKVSFSFDKSDASNGKYYNTTKVLTITVNERNFDESYQPTVTASNGSGYSFSGWSVNGEVATGTITFSGDGDYSVTYDCYDLAGNKSNTETMEEITIDKTNPVISVSYDNNNARNGNYYNASRTATITITEHNFNAANVSVQTTASGASAPGVSGWSTSGDRHTATVTFGSDADYTFDISYTDLAGNAAADYAQDSFTVDLTNPEVEITGVANKSANKGVVEPVIALSDTNYDVQGITITLVGSERGRVDISNMITTATTANGQIITFLNFGEGMDDIYTLTAEAVDKAGNETTKSITFSVNRDGSTYIINSSTKELLKKGYTNSPKDIVIQEINVDTLKFIELTYSKDGKVVKLVEGKDYTVTVSQTEGQWKMYTYTIKASCFEDEGQYVINIYSEDEAENATTNKAKQTSIEFVVDKTPPTIVISNLEDGGRYKEESHEFTLNVKDNTSLAYVEYYLDGELDKAYEDDELLAEDGVIKINLGSSGTYQTVQIKAYDAAGNEIASDEYSVLVTSSAWIQFYMNKPLFYGVIVVILAALALIIFFIGKRRKDDDEKKRA